MRPLHNSTVTSANPKLTPSNMPASVENLFPLSSATTHVAPTAICNRKTTATSPWRPHTPPTPWHQGGTMTSGAPFPHLRRDLPPHCRFQIRTDPSWYDGRASTRLSQISVPHGSQTRKPESLNVTKTLRGNLVPADHLCCPTWQHFHFTTDLPQLTAFTSPFSRPGATRFSPHDRHAKPCLRSDWARR